MFSFIVANSLSIARLIAGLAFPWITAPLRPAVALAAGLSDLVDGFVSRRFHGTSSFGRLLDPIADKTFVLMAVGTLWYEETLALWQIVLVGLRDWTVLAIGAWLLSTRNWPAFSRLVPRLAGKLATVAQFALLFAVLLTNDVHAALLYPTIALSGAAAVDYARQAWSIPESQ